MIKKDQLMIKRPLTVNSVTYEKNKEKHSCQTVIETFKYHKSES